MRCQQPQRELSRLELIELAREAELARIGAEEKAAQLEEENRNPEFKRFDNLSNRPLTSHFRKSF